MLITPQLKKKNKTIIVAGSKITVTKIKQDAYEESECCLGFSMCSINVNHFASCERREYAKENFERKQQVFSENFNSLIPN